MAGTEKTIFVYIPTRVRFLENDASTMRRVG